MMIFQKNDPNSAKKQYLYTDIKKIEKVEEKYDSNAIRPRWSFRFRVEMK